MICTACNNNSNFEVWTKAQYSLSDINGTEPPDDLGHKIDNSTPLNTMLISTILCKGCGALLYVGERNGDKWTGDLSWRLRSKVYSHKIRRINMHRPTTQQLINSMEHNALKDLLTLTLKNMEE